MLKRQYVETSPIEPDWVQERKRAQDKSAAQAVRDWPDSLADAIGFRFGLLTRSASRSLDMASAASRVYGFFGGKLFMRGYFAAVNSAPYEREV